MSKSTGSRAPRKVPSRPKKPYPEFPLYPHPLGYWSRKVAGKILHFGRWGRTVKGVVVPNEDDGAEEALRLYKARVDDVRLGDAGPGFVVTEKPADAPVAVTVGVLANHFHAAKKRQVEAGELTPRMFAEYRGIIDMMGETLGWSRPVERLTAADFARLREVMVKRWGPLRVLNGVVRAKTVFKFGYESGLLERVPRYGQEFKPPSRSVLRRHKASTPPKMLEADQIRKLLDAASVPFRAMTLLGVNCGFGNHDCASLPQSAVDLTTGWIEFPRPKTGIARRCPLWPETVEAVRVAIEQRPKATVFEGVECVFLNQHGRLWVRQGEKSRTDYLSRAFQGLLKRLGLHKDGFGFYTLRHVFRTIADAARDIPAARAIMGHVDAGIDAVYRERIDDSRLKAVTDHVHDWLWPKERPESARLDAAAK